MARKKYMHVRPRLIDVGRGPEPARIPIPGRGRVSGRRTRTQILSESGERVEATGRSGRFWRARIVEGSVEEFHPTTSATTGPKRSSEDG